MKKVFKNSEYVIWGCTPENPNESVILMEHFDNKRITDKEIANNLSLLLQSKYKCTDCRIQEITFEETVNFADCFVKTINS